MKSRSFYQISIDLCSVSSQKKVRVNFKVRLRPDDFLDFIADFRPSDYEKMQMGMIWTTITFLFWVIMIPVMMIVMIIELTVDVSLSNTTGSRLTRGVTITANDGDDDDVGFRDSGVPVQLNCSKSKGHKSGNLMLSSL